MQRYLTACRGDTKKAMTLYRYNLLLSREMFTIISCFEVALRNKINTHYLNTLGEEWLKRAVEPDGMFMNRNCRIAAEVIQGALRSLGAGYTHDKLVAELGFGFWRYQFASPQFRAAGSTLLGIFPGKPRSTPQQQYNNSYIFNALAKINRLRNRIAHHEAICFRPRQAVIDTSFAADHYNIIARLFNWMNIDEKDLLYGLNHMDATIAKIDNLI